MKTILIPMIYSCYNNCVDRPYRRGISTGYCGFGPLMDVDKLIQAKSYIQGLRGFGPLMDVDKLILAAQCNEVHYVLGLGWMLINGYREEFGLAHVEVLGLGWMLINGYCRDRDSWKILVLGLGWMLINGYAIKCADRPDAVLGLGWMLINGYKRKR